MHPHPIAFAIPALALGTALAVGLIHYARLSDNGKRRLRIIKYVLPLLLATWLAVDFFITPGHRWVNGVTLALSALAIGGGLGYEWFRRPKTRTGAKS
jgi:hypothetical protein